MKQKKLRVSLTQEANQSIVRLVQDSLVKSFEQPRKMLRSLRLRLRDANGPKGGLDKEAVLVARLKGGRQLVAKARATTFEHAAIDAADKVKAIYERLKGRIISRRRRSASLRTAAGGEL